MGDIKEICDMVHPEHGVDQASIGPRFRDLFNMENIQKTKFESGGCPAGRWHAVLNGDNDYIQQQAISTSYDKSPEKIFIIPRQKATVIVPKM